MPGQGRKFLFFGKTRSIERAQELERKHAGTFILPCAKDQWCIVKPKK